MSVSLLLVVGFTVGYVTKDLQGEVRGIKTPQEQAYKLGALLSLTGEGAYFGEGEREAVQMAVEEANAQGGIGGTDIELIVEDIGTLDTQKAMNALLKLKNIYKVYAVVGPTWDMPALALRAEEEKVVLVSPDNTESVEKEQNLDYFFSTFHPQRSELTALAVFAREQEFNTIAIVKDIDIFSNTVASLFREEAEKRGLQIIDEIAIYPEAQSDYRTVLAKLKQSPFDAVLETFADEAPRGPLIKQKIELGLEVPILGTSAVETQGLLDNYGKYIKNNTLFYAFPRVTEEQRAFYERFEKEYGRKPSGPAAPNAYDAAGVLIEAWKRGARDAEGVKTILGSLEFKSATFGTLTFDDKGFVSLESADMLIKTVRDGEFVEYIAR